jgi:hypothetical protein
MNCVNLLMMFGRFPRQSDIFLNSLFTLSY